jgi:hypothetical protein
LPVARATLGQSFGPVARSLSRTNPKRSVWSIAEHSASRKRYMSIPPTGRERPEYGTVPKLKEIQGVVGANVKTLRLDFAPEGCRTIKTFAAWVGLGNGTIDRIEKATVDAQVSSLAAIAHKFSLEPWHLFIPGVTPANKPKILTPHEMDFYLRVESLMEALPKPAAGTETGRFTTPPGIGKRTAERRRKRK